MIQPTEPAGNGVKKYPWVNDKLEIAIGISVIILVFMWIILFLMSR